jgi:hypothetical protein
MEAILQPHRHFLYYNQNKGEKNKKDSDVKTVSVSEKEER